MVTGNNTTSYPTYLDTSLTPSDIDELVKYILVHPTYVQVALFDNKSQIFCGLKTIQLKSPIESASFLSELLEDSWLRSGSRIQAISIQLAAV